MSTTIQMTKRNAGPMAMPVPVHVAARFARALAAHPHYVGTATDGCPQYGTFALDAHPDLALAVAVATDGVGPEVIGLLCQAVRGRKTVSVLTHDDARRRSASAHAEVALSWEGVDEPTLQWSSLRAERALRLAGFLYDSSEGLDVPAGDLASNCRAALARTPDEDVASLLAVAEHALADGGPSAMVMAS